MTATGSRCCSSTSTASSTSTTRSATPPATGCWSSSPTGSATTSGRRTAPPGSAETSSWCSSTISPDDSEAQAVADRLRDAIVAPFDLAGTPATVGVSIGMTYGRADGTPHTADQLLLDADTAMYRAKVDRKAAPARR